MKFLSCIAKRNQHCGKPITQKGEGAKAAKVVVLAGNPNAGKTTLFNALTHSNLKTGNWHGVTTVAKQKWVGDIVFVDVPGMYSFNGYSMEEGEAARAILKADVIINVVDCLTLKNSLNLTRQLIKKNGNVIVYLTKQKALRNNGGFVDAQALSANLGVPVLDCTAKQLKKMLESGSLPKVEINKSGDLSVGLSSRLSASGSAGGFVGGSAGGAPVMSVGGAAVMSSGGASVMSAGGAAVMSAGGAAGLSSELSKAYSGGEATLKKWERLFYNKYFALLFFVAAMAFTFFVTFYPTMLGAFLKDALENLIVRGFGGWLYGRLQNEIVRSFVCEGIIAGAGGVLAFIPQITILYLFLTLLDESGIMSALSFVTDGIFEKVNLSGRAAFSLISGFGCTAAAISTTRGYVNDDARKRTIAVLPYIPCGAKLPVFLTFLSPLFKNPFPAVCVLYFCGLALSVVLSKFLKGGEEEMITEITRVGAPQLSAVKNKLFFYVKGFIIKVTTYVTIFCMASWLLSHFNWQFKFVEVDKSMLCAISRLVCPIFYPMGIRDWRIAYALITGFAAKENVAATIALLIPEGLSLSLAQSLSLCAFLLTCPACISAFAASVKEVGFKLTAKINAVQLALSFMLAYAAYFLVGLL